MNKLNVGDYVRTKDGCIGKVIKIENDEKINIWGQVIYIDNQSMYDYLIENQIIKSSPNIIDLIEVGDILIIKDFVDEACMIFTDIYLIQNKQQLLNIKNDLEKNKNKKLYSIVTKENFENISYKVGDDK